MRPVARMLHRFGLKAACAVALTMLQACSVVGSGPHIPATNQFQATYALEKIGNNWEPVARIPGDQLEQHKNYVFHGNVIVEGHVPSGTKLVVEGGRLLVAGEACIGSMLEAWHGRPTQWPDYPEFVSPIDPAKLQKRTPAANAPVLTDKSPMMEIIGFVGDYATLKSSGGIHALAGRGNFIVVDGGTASAGGKSSERPKVYKTDGKVKPGEKTAAEAAKDPNSTVIGPIVQTGFDFFGIVSYRPEGEPGIKNCPRSGPTPKWSPADTVKPKP